MRPDIEDFLNNEMSGDDRKKFEAEMAADPALRGEVERLRPLVKDLQRAGIARQIGAAEQRMEARLKLKRASILIGAGVFFLGGLIWWKSRDTSPNQKTEEQKQESPKTGPPPAELPPPVLEKTEGSKPENLPEKKPSKKETQPIAEASRVAEIAKSQYLLPPELANLRGEKDENLSKIAKLAFEEKQFDAALDLFDRSEIADSGEARFLRGHLFFAKNDFFRAYEIFNALAAEPKFSAWKDSAEWYAVLAGLAAGDRVTRAAVEQLLDKILADGENPARARKAKKLKELIQ